MFLPDKACFDEEARYWLSVSSGVKATQQGLLFLTSPVRFGGDTYACPHTIGALCQHQNYTFLPCTDAPSTRVTDASRPFDRFWTAETKCGKFPTLYAFDVTPCDLQRGATIVWSEGRVSVQYDLDMDYWTNLCVMGIMVWLIVNLGETISMLLEITADSHHHNTVILCVALLLIITFTTHTSMWATQNDLILYWATVAYVASYVAYHLLNPNTINVIIGCMMLVVARFYQTNETPYVPTFLFLIATRFVQKLHYSLLNRATLPGRLWWIVKHAFMVADASVFAMLYSMAYMPAFESPLQAYMRLTGIVYAAYCLGSFVSDYVIHRQA